MKKKYFTDTTRAKKSLGQNFLINQGVLDKIVSASGLDKNGVVLEVGPGRGVLTEKLSEKAGRVIAIEKDRRLIEGLKEKFKKSNVEIVEGDVLKLDIVPILFPTKSELQNRGSSISQQNNNFGEIGKNLKLDNYKVVGNIPYYITSHLLKTIFEKWPVPELIVLMVQKEVAQRITAKPPHMNLLALSVQFFAEPKIISYVSKGSFRPIPKVDSAIIQLVPRQEARVTDKELVARFFKLTRTAFAGKRKQLKNTLAKFLGSKEKAMDILRKARINPEARPENLNLADWITLINQL